jgi:hypothetical protein
MSNALPSNGDGISLAAKARIDGICLAFEDAWRAGERPSIEGALGDVSGAERGWLLRELILLDCYYRVRAGESPTAAEYQASYPEEAESIAEALLDGTRSWQPAASPADEATPIASVQATAAQFLPGTMLAGRYRIVGLLGRGGMGEVYRADDLKLGQAVALKFLPRRLERDAACLEYLRREVCLARQVTHPNVCRVYDLGEAEGHPFLSMEHVDGEDLAGLLRRIGRLPSDKGLMVAQQIFAGLAAAHRQGIVHRDLKPSNIMLDSHGHVRITDFGLACLADAADREPRWVGTPLYMAPEQLARQPVTARSDLYAAGLLVYELLTGQRPFAGTSPEELRRERLQTVPRRPSLLVEDLNPAMEEIILQCLAPEPFDRPASAWSVVVRLPHADPLEAAVAAGQTPSPEMVAAARDPVSLRPALATLCLAFVLVGIVLVAWLSETTTIVGRTPLRDPAVLAASARNIVAQQGFDKPPGVEFYGFAYSDRRDSQTPIHFWYRFSPGPLVPQLYAGSLKSPGSGSVSWDDPPWLASGEAAVRLNAEGRLIEFRAVPKHEATEASERPPPVVGPPGDWWDGGFAKLWQHAGLGDSQDWTPAEPPFASMAPAATAPFAGGERRMGRGVCPDTGEPVWIEAIRDAGHPVYFRVASTSPGPLADEATAFPIRQLEAAMVALSFLLLGSAAWLARSNLRRGRADRRGAWRLAAFGFAVSLAAWVLLTSPAGHLPHWTVVVMGLQHALLWSGVLGLFYLALEPAVRRLWPAALVSWNRVLAARLGDPRVGSDTLIGVAGGVATQLMWQVTLLLPSWCGRGPPRWFEPERLAFAAPLQTLLGGRYCLGEVLQRQMYALAVGLSILLMLLVLRLVFRRQWLAGLVYVSIGVIVWPAGVGDPAFSRITSGLTSLLVAVLATRFGLVTLVSYSFVRFLLLFPMTTRFSDWHATGTTLFPLAAVAGLAVYGYHCSRKGCEKNGTGSEPKRRKPWKISGCEGACPNFFTASEGTTGVPGCLTRMIRLACPTLQTETPPNSCDGRRRTTWNSLSPKTPPRPLPRNLFICRS